MSRTTILALVFVAVLAAALWFGIGTANAAEAAPDPGELPKPEPLFKPLPPEEWKHATVNTAAGPVTLVQKWDTSGLNQLVQPKPVVPLVQTAIPTGSFRSLLKPL